MKNYLLILSICLCVISSGQKSIFIHNGENNGTGTLLSPYNNFNDAISELNPGDTLFVLSGNYILSENINMFRINGSQSSRITIKAHDASDKPQIRTSNAIDHDRTVSLKECSYITIEGCRFIGDFRDSELIYVADNSEHIDIINCDLRNAYGGITIRETDHVVISDCDIAYIFRGTRDDPEDAHGINIYDCIDLQVLRTKTVHCTGDGIQLNTLNDQWDDVLIEDCEFYAEPLDRDIFVFRVGDILGENGIDTKTQEGSGPRSNLIVRNIKSHGYTDVPYYGRRAALNLKHNINVTVYNAEIYNNEIGMRLRGEYNGLASAHITLINNVVYNNTTGMRFENGVENLKIYNSTFDKVGIQDYFDNTDNGYGAERSSLEIQNCLFYDEKPMEYSEAAHASNLVANDSDFYDRSKNNYWLTENSIAIDAGINIDMVEEDFMGLERRFNHYDVGAYEYAKYSSYDSFTSTNEYEIYPNPVHDKATVQFFEDSLFNSVNFIIYSLGGELVYSKDFDYNSDNSYALDINHFDPGLYLLFFEISKKQYVRKLVKQ